MNIFATKGHRVVFTTYEAGYQAEMDRMKEIFELGKVYTVERTVIHSWSTELYLQEFPGERFNTCFFSDLYTKKSNLCKYEKKLVLQAQKDHPQPDDELKAIKKLNKARETIYYAED